MIKCKFHIIKERNLTMISGLKIFDILQLGGVCNLDKEIYIDKKGYLRIPLEKNLHPIVVNYIKCTFGIDNVNFIRNELAIKLRNKSL